MAMMTVRNLPDGVHRALRMRALLNGRSAEAEVRAILTDAVNPEGRVRMGDAIAALSRKFGLTNEDFENLAGSQDRTEAKPLRFE